ncbi:hypothetical protein [Spiroplasma endosymbiont of Atherix ibis]|uniref:hypothetical protein n=1 Tax=Spiroplasma endosymbiont of Atherix ibis TaxID=3066291 RepID=UPI0030D33274
MKILIMLWTFLNPFSYAASTYEVIKENSINNLDLNTNNQINKNKSIDYKSLIEPNQKNAYYGRILKYYYANSIEVNNEDITTIESNLDIGELFGIGWLFGKRGTNSKFYKQLIIQNMLASTIMPSIYGASSDQEFFAESFSKWLNTDDDIKNKSWEVTNNFYINILPKIISVGGRFDDIYQENQTIFDKTIEIVNSYLNSSAKVKYDATLGKNESNALNLQYSPSIIWNNSHENALSNIIEQVEKEFQRKIILSNKPKITQIVSAWMYDSYTPASKESINSFNNFNNKHYNSFEELDTKLQNSSKDINNYSTVWFSHIYENLEQNYLSKTPNIGINNEKWTKKQTLQLKETTLKMYNALFNLIKNEEWINKLLLALIITPDFPLKLEKKGVMGYTSTLPQIKGNGIFGRFISIRYSYIVITGPSLTYKKFNNQYKTGFWSSPNKYSVLIHEMGHVVDHFGSKNSENRLTNYSKAINYKNLYEGEFFGEYTPSSLWINKSLWIIVGSVAATIGTITIFYLVITKIRVKKSKK